MPNSTPRCACTVGSMTQALRAKRVLERVGIRSSPIPADPTRTHAGCAYALSLPCTDADRARVILHNVGFTVKDSYREETL